MHHAGSVRKRSGDINIKGRNALFNFVVSILQLCYCFGMKMILRFFRTVIVFVLIVAAGMMLYKYVGQYISSDFSMEPLLSSASATPTPVPSDELVFDAAVYPYYDQLNETQKGLYTEFYSNALALNDTFIPNEDITAEDLETVFRCVFCDHPELFWLDTKYNYQYMEESKKIVSVTLNYNETAEDIEASKAAFNNSANEILVAAQQYSTDYEKEKYVHDALIAKNVYDLNSALNQSAFSAMCSGSTVCAGYARSFQYLLQQLNIPCYYVIGTSEGEDHAWNIVLIDGSFYNVDLTWDDCASEDDPYYFFNLDDASFNEYHTRASLSTTLPNCTSTLLAHKEDADIYQSIRFTLPQ